MTQEEMLSQMESMLQPLQQANASQAETIKKLTEQNESLQSRIKELTAQVAWLNRQLFGRKSEKLPIIDPNYPDLFAGMLPENAQQIADARAEAVDGDRGCEVQRVITDRQGHHLCLYPMGQHDAMSR